MDTLKDTLTAAMKDAMRAKEKFRLGVIRMALAEIKRVEVDERIDVDDARCLVIIDKMSKQRRDAAKQFTDGGRQDLADIELAELKLLKEFLPAQLSETEIISLVDQVITTTDASGPQGIGIVMGQLKPQLQGRADMQVVSKLVKSRLG
ncbi:MAG: glutamyl-tRNA amidotransferase [Gammaproteobacteria bacterium]|nr:glutamyl-tRNA amidotransferase [Gammaproteobacteria bacterium]HAN80205.1 glutamyl-tRNA amidotransferase [Gammaproteobacteria bacterium]